MKPTHLTAILQSLVAQSLAVYEPPRQTQTVMLYWRRPEDWGEVLFEWVSVPPGVYI
jgi:ESCRT-II complex subunit VPS25